MLFTFTFAIKRWYHIEIGSRKDISMNYMIEQWLRNNVITQCDSHNEETAKNRDTIQTDLCGKIIKRDKTHKQKLHIANNLHKK